MLEEGKSLFPVLKKRVKSGRVRAQEEGVDAQSRYVAPPAAEYILRGPRNELTIGE